MQVNINKENIINGYATRDIADLNTEEFADISFALNFRLEILEEKLEEYKQSEDERMKQFIPKTESKINRLKNLIKLMK